MPRKKSSQKKKLTLDTYLAEIQQEINIRSTNIVNKFAPEITTEMLSLDNDIRPSLLVLCSDILGSNKEYALNNAAIMKSIILGLKAMQEGALPNQLPNIDLFALLASAGPAITSATGITGSFLECTGKNLMQGNESNIWQYGLCMHIGASGNPQNGLAYDIGILIGNIQTNKYPDNNYEKLQELIKQLPKNKYRYLLVSFAKKIYDEIKNDKYGTIINTRRVTPSNIDTNKSEPPKPKLKPRKKKSGKEEYAEKLAEDLAKDIDKAIKESDKVIEDKKNNTVISPESVADMSIEDKPIKFTTEDGEKQ